MISFEYRILSEYKIKVAKIDTLVKSIMTHNEPNSVECKDASKFLDVMINEIDQFYQNNNEVLSKNGKTPHARSRLPQNKKWLQNIERFYELNPNRRPRK